MAPLPSRSPLPAANLTPNTLLGGGTGDRDTIGHMYAAQIANHLSLQNPDSGRTLVLGLGMRDMEGGREGFVDVLELVQKIL
jgi:proteasome assembly chaperone 3